MSKNPIVEIKDCVNDASNILITAHQFPDPDAVGSILALAMFLKAKKKNVMVWLDQSKENFNFLPGFEDIQTTFDPEFHFDCCIVCDCSNLERVKGFAHINNANWNYQTINIDHHSDNNYFGDINHVQKRSSVGEMLFYLFQELNVEISEKMATCLYTAISFDTGRFSFSSVTSDTLHAAATLVEKGAKPADITHCLDENKTVKDLDLVKIAIANLVVNTDKKYCYTVLPKTSFKANIKIIDFLRCLGEYEVYVVFQELKTNLVKVNLRSRSYFNVSDFAQQFGGGGHIHASGILSKTDLSELKIEIIAQLEQALETLQ